MTKTFRLCIIVAVIVMKYQKNLKGKGIMKKQCVSILLLSALISGCFEENKPTWFAKSNVTAFQTTVFFQFYSTSDQIVSLNKEAIAQIRTYHELFDRHNDYEVEAGVKRNNLKTINDSYGTGNPVFVADALGEVLRYSLEQGVKTNGSFNLAIGELSDYWSPFINPSIQDLSNYLVMGDFLYCEIDECTPKDEEVQELLVCTPSSSELVDLLKIEAVPTGGYNVTFNKYNECDNVSLTLGGIGKGYALREIGDSFKEQGIPSFFFASSSYYYADESIPFSYAIPVTDPLQPYQANAFAFTFKNNASWLANSTSGDYEQGYYNKVDDLYVLRHHIINPNTGYSENYFRSISVYMDDPAIADILTTAFFNYPLEVGYELYLDFKEEYPELEVVWVGNLPGETTLKVFATKDIYGQIESKYTLIDVDAYIQGLSNEKV